LVAILAQGSKDLDGVSPLGSNATHSPIANHITHDTAVASGSSTKVENLLGHLFSAVFSVDLLVRVFTF
jgi:hypothetical protein